MKTPSRYDEYLLTPHWQEMRRKALRHNFGRCCACGNREDLNVHHLNYDNLYHENVEDLSVLCRRCHEIYHFVIPKINIPNVQTFMPLNLSEIDEELLKL